VLTKAVNSPSPEKMAIVMPRPRPLLNGGMKKMKVSGMSRMAIRVLVTAMPRRRSTKTASPGSDRFTMIDTVAIYPRTAG
jgi:hypothetical protein